MLRINWLYLFKDYLIKRGTKECKRAYDYINDNKFSLNVMTMPAYAQEDMTLVFFTVILNDFDINVSKFECPNCDNQVEHIGCEVPQYVYKYLKPWFIQYKHSMGYDKPMDVAFFKSSIIHRVQRKISNGEMSKSVKKYLYADSPLETDIYLGTVRGVKTIAEVLYFNFLPVSSSAERKYFRVE